MKEWMKSLTSRQFHECQKMKKNSLDNHKHHFNEERSMIPQLLMTFKRDTSMPQSVLRKQVFLRNMGRQQVGKTEHKEAAKTSREGKKSLTAR